MHSKARVTAEVELQLGAWAEPETLLNYRLPEWQNLRASGIRHFFIECFKHGRLDLRMLDTTRPDYLPRLLREQLGDQVAVHAWVHTLRWSIDHRSATRAELHSARPQPLSGPHHLACDLRSYSDLLLTHGAGHLSWDIERNGGLFADATRLHDGLRLVDSPLLWACEQIAANRDIQTIHLDYCRYPNPNIDPLRRHIAYHQQHGEHEKHLRPRNIAQLLQALVARFGRARLSATPIAALNLEVGQDCRDFFRLTHLVVPQCYSETDRQVRDFLEGCGDSAQMMGGVVHGPLPAHPYGAHAQIARIRRLGDGHAGLVGVCFWKLSPGLIKELAVAGA